MKLKTYQLKIFGLALLLFLGVFVVYGTKHLQAAPLEPGQSDLQQAICKKLQQEVPNSNLKDQACNSYIDKKDADAAMDKVCSTYPKKLKSECDAYKSYKKGSGRQAKSGADAGRVDDPALECKDMSDMKCNLVKKYLSPFITFLSALVGLAVVVGIISGGIRIASAEGDPQKLAGGKNQIRGAIIALVFFIFLYAAINWLVPGGI